MVLVAKWSGGDVYLCPYGAYTVVEEMNKKQ